MSFPPQDTLERAAQALKTGARREAPSGRGRGHRRAAGQRGRGLLELPVAPAQLLRLGLVLRPRPAQLPKQVLVGADQGGQPVSGVYGGSMAPLSQTCSSHSATVQIGRASCRERVSSPV